VTVIERRRRAEKPAGRSSSTIRKASFVAVASVTALVVTACSSGAGTATSSSAGAGGAATTAAGGSGASGLAAAAAAVKAGLALPTWKAPGPSIDGTKLKGKKIFVIPITSQSAFVQQVEPAMQEAADAAGVTLTFFTNQGKPDQWVQGMNAAIAAKPDLIFLEAAPDPRLLQPQLQAAKAAGIPVVASHIWDEKDPDAPGCVGCENLTAVVKGPFSQAGAMTASWTVNDSQGKANVLLVGIQGINSGDLVIAAQKATFSAQCPECKVKVVSLTLDQITDGAIQPVTTALTADPGINYIIPSFDILTAGTVASLKISNRTEGTKVLGFGGTGVVMGMVADPTSNVAMDAAEPLAWTAYANMDQAFRILAGMSPVQSVTPARIFDRTNISQAGSAPNYADGFGSDFKAGFLKLWNLG
jgi:ribose transport system substrate-binding protein